MSVAQQQKKDREREKRKANMNNVLFGHVISRFFPLLVFLFNYSIEVLLTIIFLSAQGYRREEGEKKSNRNAFEPSTFRFEKKEDNVSLIDLIRAYSHCQ